MGSSSSSGNKKLRAAFLHPDMGIGGAEQLVINLALALQNSNFDVTIYTPRFDRERAFEPVKNGEIKVSVHGNWWPRTICGRLVACCSYIRMYLCSLYVALFTRHYDIIIVDQVPLPCMVLRFFTTAKLVFYSHYPDKLLCLSRNTWYQKLYRAFIDRLEEVTLSRAHLIVVNSKFTQNKFTASFRCISQGKCCFKKRNPPQVIYPSIDLNSFVATNIMPIGKIPGLEYCRILEYGDVRIITSLNRYERKKNINLALESFSRFVRERRNHPERFLLIIAGGYDNDVRENVEHYQELIALTNDLQIQSQVVFLRSISNEARAALLHHSTVILYTPENEHFGIVPLEAMYCKNVVIACNNGGPTETVRDGLTGYLVPNNIQLWKEKLLTLFDDENRLLDMTEAAQQWVENNYTQETLQHRLFDLLLPFIPPTRRYLYKC